MAVTASITADLGVDEVSAAGVVMVLTPPDTVSVSMVASKVQAAGSVYLRLPLQANSGLAYAAFSQRAKTVYVCYFEKKKLGPVIIEKKTRIFCPKESFSHYSRAKPSSPNRQTKRHSEWQQD